MEMLRHPAAAAIAVIGLTALVFARTVTHGWVEFDDLLHVVENPNLTPVTWQSFGELWMRGYGHLYIPVSYTLFAVEATLARQLSAAGPTAVPAPWIFHATSLALHVVATLMVCRILGRRFGSPWAAAAGAAVFAVHPLQVESVAWISEQRGVLASLLVLLAIDRFLAWSEARAEGAPSWWNYAAALAFYILALLAKPSSVVAPVVALLLACERSKSPWPRTLAALTPWFACGVGIWGLTRAMQPATLNASSVAPVDRLLVAADAIAFYAAKLVVPWNLCVAYGRTPAVVLADPATPWVAAGVIATLAAIAGLPHLRGWRLPTALFVIPLLPVLGLVPFVFQNQSTVADRYASLSLLGPAVAVAGWLGSVGAAARLPRVATAVAVVGLAALSWSQVGVWRDTGTLAAQAVRVAPGVSGSWTLLAAHELAGDDPQRAVESASRAIEIAPDNRIAWLNLGAGFTRLGNLDAARDAFDRLHRLGLDDADLAAIFYNRGCTALRAGQDAAAAADFRLASDRDPRHPRAAANLGVALARLGKVDEAIDVLRVRLAREPRDAAAWVGLGNLLLNLDRPDNAAACYSAALDLDPNDPSTLLNRATARLAAGDRQGAADDVEAATELGGRPDATLVRLLERTAGRR